MKKKFLFVSMPARGHLNLTIPVAKKLVEMGCQVFYSSSESFRSEIERIGFDFFSIGPANACQSKIEEWIPEIGNLKTTELQDAFLKKWFYALTPSMTKDLLEVIKFNSPDVLFVDSTAFCGGIVHELTGIPWATFSAGILWLPSKDLPPFGLGLPPPKTPKEMAELKTMNNIAHQYITKWDNQMNQIRALFGLKPSKYSSINLSSQLVLYFVTNDFEYPRSDLPDYIKLVGPSIWSETQDNNIPEKLKYFPLEKPLIYVTLGTVFNYKKDLFRKIISALEKLDIQVVISVGSNKYLKDFENLPENFIVENYIHHSSIFPNVSLIICHGGFNTSLEALSYGIPLICIPISADQFEVSQRVVEVEAGIRIDADKLNSTLLREFVKIILKQPYYRDHAMKLKASFSRHNGPLQSAKYLLKLAEM